MQNILKIFGFGDFGCIANFSIATIILKYFSTFALVKQKSKLGQITRQAINTRQLIAHSTISHNSPNNSDMGK